MTKDYQLDFEPVFGEAGTTKTIVAHSPTTFMGEKLIANDTSGVPGAGTRIGQITVDKKSQRPDGWSLTVFFSKNAFGNGIKWDTGKDIEITVSFVESCTFEVSVLGRAIL